jgi:hypothetical protein
LFTLFLEIGIRAVDLADLSRQSHAPLCILHHRKEIRREDLDRRSFKSKLSLNLLHSQWIKSLRSPWLTDLGKSCDKCLKKCPITLK